MRRPAFCCLAVAATATTQPAADTVLVPRDSSAATIAGFKNLQTAVERSPSVVVDAPNTRADLAILRSGNAELVNVRPLSGPLATAAIPLSRSRIRQFEGDIEKLVTSDPSGSPSFLTRLRSRYQTERTPFLGVSSMAIANASTSAVNAQGAPGLLTVNESLATDLLRARAQGFAVRPAELQLLLDKADASQSKTAVFYKKYNEALEALDAAIEQSDEANQSEFQNDVNLTLEAFIQIWPELEKDAQLRSEAVRHIAGLLEQSPVKLDPNPSELKAMYALPSNFEPQSYSQIYSQSLRSVAIHERGSQFCSGYMVSAEWLMTAGHCLKRGDARDFEVAITPAQGGVAVKARIDDQWPLAGTGRLDTDPIDYVFLHVASNPQFQQVWSAIEQRVPMCLKQEAPGYAQPVLVIAHRPGDTTLKVYDHAYVWFPFKAREQRYKEFRAITGAKLQRLAEAWFKSPAKQKSFFDLNMKDFANSYVLNGSDREYRAERAGLALRPYFGMDTDTFKGNSGAPVFARDGVCVVGVFSGGALEGARITEGTWKQHEFAMPLSEVVAHVRGLDPAAGNATDAQKTARQALLALLPQ